MPPKRKASYATRVAQRRRVEANNPHPSQLTVHPAAGETPQISTRLIPPLAQGQRRVNAAWLENLGNTIAAPVQKSLQDASISVTNPPTPSQPEVQFVPDAPQANNAVSHTPDGSSMTQTPDKVKKQIWGNEYVDFAVIFHNSTSSEDQYTFKVQNGKDGQPTLSLEPSVKKQPVHTIEQ